MNTLTPAAPGSRSSSGSSSTFSRVAPTKNAKSQCMRPRPRATLSARACRAHRRRLGVRHFEHRRDAAKHRRPAAGLQVFLVFEARLAEMHLRVDDAGEHMQAGGVDALAGLARRQAADGRDFPRFDANIGEAFAGMIDEGGAFDEEIEGFGQG